MRCLRSPLRAIATLFYVEISAYLMSSRDIYRQKVAMALGGLSRFLHRLKTSPCDCEKGGKELLKKLRLCRYND